MATEISEEVPLKEKYVVDIFTSKSDGEIYTSAWLSELARRKGFNGTEWTMKSCVIFGSPYVRIHHGEDGKKRATQKHLEELHSRGKNCDAMTNFFAECYAYINKKDLMTSV